MSCCTLYDLITSGRSKYRSFERASREIFADDEDGGGINEESVVNKNADVDGINGSFSPVADSE